MQPVVQVLAAPAIVVEAVQSPVGLLPDKRVFVVAVLPREVGDHRERTLDAVADAEPCVLAVDSGPVPANHTHASPKPDTTRHTHKQETVELSADQISQTDRKRIQSVTQTNAVLITTLVPNNANK